MAPTDVQRNARALARRQHWVITRGQLLALGFTAEAIKHRIVGEGAVLSHESAAFLWGIVKVRPQVTQVTVPAGRNPRRRGIEVHRRAIASATRHKGVPLTSPIQTLLDIAPRMNETQLERAINEAVNRDLVDPDWLRSELARRSGQTGVATVRRRINRDTFVLTDSELEQRFLPIARAAGYPKPQTQVYVNGFRVDFYFAELGVVVEADSLRFHRTAGQQRRDRERDQAHVAAGLTPLRFTHSQIFYEPLHVKEVLVAVARAH
jgi:very-short-patch-repair endonuclease